MKVTIEFEVPIDEIRQDGNLDESVTDNQIAEEYKRQVYGLVTEYEDDSICENTANSLNEDDE